MAWTDWIDDALVIAGAIMNKDDAKSPDVPEPIDPELLKALMFQNSVSPYGNTTWSEGPDGTMTSTYEFTPQQQQQKDRLDERIMNPDQAYQMSGDMQTLKNALTSRRLAGLGLPSGGGQSSTPFSYTPVVQGDLPTTAGSSDPRKGPMGGGEATGSGSKPEGYGSAGKDPRAVYGDKVVKPGHSNYRDLNDAINSEFGVPLEGSNPDWLEQFMAENGDWLGRGVGALTGIPGLGWLAGKMQDNYWKDHQWQSPIPDDAQQPTLNDLVDQQYPSGNESLPNSPHINPNVYSPAFGSSGPWYTNAYGNTVFSYSGHPRQSWQRGPQKGSEEDFLPKPK